jgi:hypothetical protein
MIACEGTARLGIRPVHRSHDFRRVVDAAIDAKLGAPGCGHRATKAFDRALEGVDVGNLKDLGCCRSSAHPPLRQIARSGVMLRVPNGWRGAREQLRHRPD